MRIYSGQRALVTGAASGIGRAIALALARRGVDLWLLDIHADGLADVCHEAREIGVTVHSRECDLSQPAEISIATSQLLDVWGGVNILVNNAGIVYYGPMDLMTSRQWDRLLSVNLLAPIQITRELLLTLLDRCPEAHVLNVCSIMGLVAGGGRASAYETSKFGLVGFTEALRGEYGRQGLGVTAVCPGPVRTGLFRNGMAGRQDQSVPEPPAWLTASPETVACRALRAIEHNRRQVLITPMAHVLWRVKRFAPWLLDAISQFGVRKKMKLKQGAALRTTAAAEVTGEHRKAA